MKQSQEQSATGIPRMVSQKENAIIKCFRENLSFIRRVSFVPSKIDIPGTLLHGFIPPCLTGACSGSENWKNSRVGKCGCQTEEGHLQHQYAVSKILLHSFIMLYKFLSLFAESACFSPMKLLNVYILYREQHVCFPPILDTALFNQVIPTLK